ncbi:Asp23 family, cell envelope-related function [Lentzea waywayandensis]|uniref:Asp23 family, cell envelope-related function n=1 Tax=Lentzea waywayandensis TaxID=84724 RepID=A0A1I6F296_9PSEU|nr:Asp23/Gls24 family envelope stress response protein [Lentzea waywayandensis]SFR24090.1 Asp23 family, cell envelope-related function [Lentzea waywayandensis]
MIETVVSAPAVAAVAVHAAERVAGVRVQPGVAGLVSSVVRAARQQIKGLQPAPVEGVRVRWSETAAVLEVDVVISGQDQAAAVAQAVQRSVRALVPELTGVEVESVLVTIVDVAW